MGKIKIKQIGKFSLFLIIVLGFFLFSSIAFGSSYGNLKTTLNVTSAHDSENAVVETWVNVVNTSNCAKEIRVITNETGTEISSNVMEDNATVNNLCKILFISNLTANTTKIFDVYFNSTLDKPVYDENFWSTSNGYVFIEDVPTFGFLNSSLFNISTPTIRSDDAGTTAVFHDDTVGALAALYGTNNLVKNDSLYSQIKVENNGKYAIYTFYAHNTYAKIQVYNFTSDSRDGFYYDFQVNAPPDCVPTSGNCSLMLRNENGTFSTYTYLDDQTDKPNFGFAITSHPTVSHGFFVAWDPSKFTGWNNSGIRPGHWGLYTHMQGWVGSQMKGNLSKLNEFYLGYYPINDTQAFSNRYHTLIDKPTIVQGAVIVVNSSQPDTTPPTVNLVLPVNNDITNKSTQTFWCNASDSVAVSDLTFYLWNSTSQLFTKPQVKWNITTNIFGADKPNDVLVDSSGNIYVVGYDNAAVVAGADVFLVKYDSAGNYLWNMSFVGSDTEAGDKMVFDSSGNLFIAGHTRSYGTGIQDLLLLKYDSNGNQLWNKTEGGSGMEDGNSIAIDDSDNIYIGGWTNSFGAGSNDFWILKYDSSNNLLWNKTYGGTAQEDGMDIRLDSSGNIYIVGITASFGAGGNDCWLLKLDSNGNHLWNRTAGGASGDNAYGMEIDSLDNIYITGMTSSFGAGGTDVWTLKYDSSGNQLWNRTAGGAGSEMGLSLASDGLGNIFIDGQTSSWGAGGNDLWVLKYDSSGNLLWNDTLGGSNGDDVGGITSDEAGNIYASSYCQSCGGGVADIWLIKYTQPEKKLSGTSSTVNWTFELPSEGIYKWSCLASDSSGNSAWASSNYTLNYSAAPICTQSLANTTLTSWQNEGSCLTNDTQLQNRTIIQYDVNACGGFSNQTIMEYQYVACNYCSFSTANSSFGSWQDQSACLANDTKLQNRSMTEYDSNYASCYAITGLPSDLWANMTHWETQYISCDYCSYSLANTSWSALSNQGACLINDTQLQNSSMQQYDSNYASCYAVTSLPSDLWNSGNNITYWNHTTTSCDYCSPVWAETNSSCLINNSIYGVFDDTNGCYAATGLASDNLPPLNTIYSCDYCIPIWSETNSTCQTDDSIHSSFNDLNSCFAATGLSSDNTAPSNATYSCDYCAPIWSETNSSCLTDDLIHSSFSDTISCYATTSLASDNLPPPNSTYSCDYCSYSLANTTWTSWQNQSSCLINDTLLQNRSMTEFDNNYATCYVVTNLPSDLWNGGIAIKHWEYNYASCDYCAPSWQRTNTTCQITDLIIEWSSDSNSCYTTTGLSSDNAPANTTHACDYCLPEWTCTNHNSTGDCLSVVDKNNCNSATSLVSDNYAGDYSEFKTSVPFQNVSDALNGTDSNGIVTNNTITSSTLPSIQIVLENHNLSDWTNIAGSVEVGFKSGNNEKKIAEFDYNFTSSTINMAEVTIEQASAERGDPHGYVLINGIDTFSLVNQTKTLYVNRLNHTMNHMCIKDADIGAVSEISNGCNGNYEHFIKCDNTTTDGYTCTYDSITDQYKITGLAHSAITQSMCLEDWSCTAWSACSNSLQTRTCTDANVCGTTADKPAENQSCSTAPPSSPSGSSGGGSSGGSSSGAIAVASPKMSFDISEIKAGTAKSLKLSSNLISISEIIMTSNKNLKQISLTVESLSGKPSTLPTLDEKVFQYIDISKSKFENSDISSLKIRFTIPKSWFVENNADQNNVYLQRYESLTPVKLKTTKVAESGSSIAYEAASPGFSYFAVTAAAGSQKQSEVSEGSSVIIRPSSSEKVEEKTPSNLITGAATSSFAEGGKNYLPAILISFTVAVLISLVYFKTRKPSKKDTSQQEKPNK